MLDENKVTSLYSIGIKRYEGILNGVTETFGDMGYTSAQIEELALLYAEGKGGSPVESVELGDDVTWNYLDGDLPGDINGEVYETGDSWIYGGNYYIKLGSGLEGTGSAVPEVPMATLLSYLYVLKRKIKKEG